MRATLAFDGLSELEGINELLSPMESLENQWFSDELISSLKLASY